MQDFTSEFEIIEYADTLKPNEENAKILLDLAYSYDIYYLYDIIFNDYIEFLTDEEKEKLREKCKETFDPELLIMSGFLDKL
jgi:hypothetical protein